MTVHCEDGLISRVERGAPAGLADSEIWLCPGLVDLQVNRYRSCDLNAADLEFHTVQSLARNLLATGATTFVPTLITAMDRAARTPSSTYGCRTFQSSSGGRSCRETLLVW
jgi:N-acetylglucosamine-6-phosphate deacetylase